MSHLHLPDGVLPLWLWGGGWLLALLLVWRFGRTPSTQQIAYQGALGGLMLAAMSLPVGPLDYHLSLAGPVGILLGAAGGFQVAFTVSALLAFMGHGGVTVIGLNALLSGGCAAAAAGSYRALAPRLKPAWAMTWATALGQSAAALMWFAVVTIGTRGIAQERLADPDAPHGHPVWFAALTLPLMLLGVLVEATVAWGIGRYLGRVSPALLPSAAEGAAWDPTAEEAAP